MERRKDLKGKGNRDVSCKPVVIGDDVWIAGEVIVLKGVEVGDRAILGTRAVVTRSVETETVVAGNPARPVKGNRVNR
jgi:acetyltransferase-like isoleucine patch superfamily enzyme